jgi:glycosyltransferase involved in cell wall biosynthesis
MAQLNVLHIITHLAIGGATKNMLTICRHSDPDRWNMAVLAGPTYDEDGALDGDADDMGLARHTLPSLRRSIHPVADHRAYRDLVRWIGHGKWDIVHTHGSKAGVLARLAASSARVPVIIHTVHGWGHNNYQNPMMRKVLVHAERRAARITDRLIAVSDATLRKGMRDRIGDRPQYHTIPVSIDVERFRDVTVDAAALRAEIGIPAGALVVGTVGRLAPQKAPDDFVRMAAAVHRSRPDTHFVYVGGGPMQEAVEGMVRKAGLEQVVHLLGFRSDVPELLRVFDIFVLNSLWEGLPTVFAEAMCAALPIVATQVDGAPEAIQPGVNGVLVPPGDPEHHAAEVLTLLADEPRRKEMGRRGLEMVHPKFCEVEMVRRIHDVYTQCAREKGLIHGKVDGAEIRLSAGQVG